MGSPHAHRWQWRDNVDASLGEGLQAYQIDVFADGTYATVKRTLASFAPSSYTSAQRVADFGGNQSTLYLKGLSTVVQRRPGLSAHAIHYEVTHEQLNNPARSDRAVAGVERSHGECAVRRRQPCHAVWPARLAVLRTQLVYYGGVMVVDGVLTAISNNAAALVLSASARTISRRPAPAWCRKTPRIHWPGAIPLYTVVTGASTVTSYTTIAPGCSRGV